MDDKKVAFLPFHAINDFMRPDYRLEVVRTAVSKAPGLPGAIREPLERMVRQVVQVPGFRNSAKAPTPLKVKPVAEAFEKNAALAAAVLAAWAEVQTKLRQQVYDLLAARNWEALPPDTDRTKLPGFLTRWPAGEDFESLNAAFAEMYPYTEASSDDVSLMIVWVSTRLPYDVQEAEGEEGEAETSEGEQPAGAPEEASAPDEA